MVSYIRLAHPLTSVSAAAAAYTGAVVAGSAFVPERTVLMALLSVLLITAGSMVVNDITDAATDKANSPKRPIPSGKVSKGKATAWAALLLVIGNFIAFYFLPREALYVTIAATALSVAYHTAAKKIPVAGNVVASALLVVAIFFGSFVQGDYMSGLNLMVLAFLSHMSYEIYKTVEAAIGDKHTAHRTIATKVGVIRARMVGSLFIAAVVIASFVPFFTNIYSAVYLFFAVIADIILVAAAVSPLRLSSKLIKVAIVIIFLAFLADVYNFREIASPLLLE